MSAPDAPDAPDAPPERRFGWSVLGSDGTRHWFGDVPLTRALALTRDGDTPFRTADGPVEADPAWLGAEYAVPADLVADVVDWWTAYQQRPVPTPHAWDQAHRERWDGLARRLRAVVPRDVYVQPADFAPEPVVVRMASAHALGLGLWSTAVGWPPRPSFEEETLAIDDDLRARMRAWVEEDAAATNPDAWTQAWAEDHDRRGHALSRELRAQLGDGYRVRYSTHTRAGRLAGLDDPDE